MPATAYQKPSEVNISDEFYPEILRQIQNPPEKLFVRGETQALTGKNIAIVGTRRATSIGLKLAEEIAYELAKLGLGITSGLAMGIDTAAHKGALRAKGRTIAVLAGRIDSVYPSSNEQLAEAIIATGGALVSEYPPGTPTYKGNFLERNRITSGISIATIIIEAPIRSGSISTAGWAGEQGRQVFVVPGPINNKNYEGSHKLIRDGATLISKVEDIIEDLGLEVVAKEKHQSHELDPNENRLLDAIRKIGRPAKIDEIIAETDFTAPKILSAIAKLSLKNIIVETPQGYALFK